MQVKLISFSQPAVEGFSKPIDLVAYCAKVSNPAGQDKMDTAPKLLKYLKDNAHWSPFEMVSVCIEIITTRDIARQILRHRSFSFQEFSQRYADVRLLQDGYITREARLQDSKNRQNSISLSEADDVRIKDWENEQKAVYDRALEAYGWALDNGIAKEQARAVLPEGNTVSKLYMAGTLRSWIHYVELRSGNGTQKEHQEIAIAIGEILNELYDLDLGAETAQKNSS